MEELDFKEVLIYILRKWLVILIIFVVIFIIGSVYTFGFKQPMYASSTTIVLTRLNNDSVDNKNEISATDVQLNKALLSSYREIIRSKKVLGQVKKTLKLKYSVSELRTMVEVTNVKDTELIDIKISSKNKKETDDIANEISKIFAKEIKEIYNIENVKTIDFAEESKVPYNINNKKDLLIFSIIGLAVGVAATFTMFYFDTKIKTVKEVSEKTKLTILGSIPKEYIKKGGKKK